MDFDGEHYTHIFFGYSAILLPTFSKNSTEKKEHFDLPNNFQKNETVDQGKIHSEYFLHTRYIAFQGRHSGRDGAKGESPGVSD
jgi:hypothetical protein